MTNRPEGIIFVTEMTWMLRRLIKSSSMRFFPMNVAVWLN